MIILPQYSQYNSIVRKYYYNYNNNKIHENPTYNPSTNSLTQYPLNPIIILIILLSILSFVPAIVLLLFKYLIFCFCIFLLFQISIFNQQTEHSSYYEQTIEYFLSTLHLLLFHLAAEYICQLRGQWRLQFTFYSSQYGTGQCCGQLDWPVIPAGEG